ncbi:hypothetical protein F441_19858, partial [Phytophthora nicotianae CJ01A1]
HFNATSTVPFPRKENWTKHLDECLYYARVTGKSAQSDENQAETNESYAQADKHQRTSPPACTPVEIMIFLASATGISCGSAASRLVAGTAFIQAVDHLFKCSLWASRRCASSPCHW